MAGANCPGTRTVTTESTLCLTCGVVIPVQLRCCPGCSLCSPVTLHDPGGGDDIWPGWLEHCVAVMPWLGWPGEAGRPVVFLCGRQGEAGQVVEFGLGDPGVLADAQYLGGDLVLCHLQGQAERELAVDVALAAGRRLALAAPDPGPLG